MTETARTTAPREHEASDSRAVQIRAAAIEEAPKHRRLIRAASKPAAVIPAMQGRVSNPPLRNGANGACGLAWSRDSGEGTSTRCVKVRAGTVIARAAANPSRAVFSDYGCLLLARGVLRAPKPDH